jgi:predicted CoA-binding protein
MGSRRLCTACHHRGVDDWRTLLIEDDTGLRALLTATRSIAVLGIKPESHGDQPAHYVAAYLDAAGFELTPVPVYYPDVTHILGHTVRRSLAGIGHRVDLVVVFRKPADLAAHMDELLAAAPRAVWLQKGIRDDAFAASLAQAGIAVVQDRCIMVEHRRLVGYGAG